ncbi:hypothetical protein NC653_007167 [Populus alba x Populus x berolinensis]|uniref:Uncharacterized protein n=1 Tax=Populus alba x Populus x berolinensis TaxID=444605 RepID=A0AAD6RHR3_9ROSI|nr:hypothetical protein NC653_007167 [Populus alba x Populus x berolinensis]
MVSRVALQKGQRLTEVTRMDGHLCIELPLREELRVLKCCFITELELMLLTMPGIHHLIVRWKQGICRLLCC